MKHSDLLEELERRVRSVCGENARYRVLWIVGPPRSHKTGVARAACQRFAWQYVDFTLDSGYLDGLIGREEDYQPDDFLEMLHLLVAHSQEDVICIDEIEPMLSWWNSDKREAFFRQMTRATRLTKGVIIVTRLGKSYLQRELGANKDRIFEMPERIEL